MIAGTQLIGNGGSSQGSSTFKALNPATGELLGPEFHEATSTEVDAAFTLAAGAAEGIGQSRLAERAALLERVAASLSADRDAIISRCQQETGYPSARVQSEFTRMLGLWSTFAEVVREGSWLDARLDAAQPERQPLPKPDIRRMNVPVGAIAIFASSNFPLALGVAGSDTVSALAAGCPAVVKGHPSHPGTSELLGRAMVRAISESGFPHGAFSLLQGVTQELGAALVQHPVAQAVGFTGSLRGGRALFDLASARPLPIPVYAEMGSVNPQFVFPDILANSPEDFAEGLFASVTMGNGQFCTNPGLVCVVKHTGLETFTDRYVALAEAAPAAPMLNSGMTSAFAAGVEHWQELSEVTMLVGPQVSECHVAPVLACIDAESFLKHHESLLEEVFGPATMLIMCEDRAQFVELAQIFPGQLCTSVHGHSDDTLALITTLQRFAGRIVINGFPTGIETTHAMHHGGPYPATTHSQHTSLGQSAIARWLRPVCFQNTPNAWLPAALQDANPLGIRRLVDGTVETPV